MEIIPIDRVEGFFKALETPTNDFKDKQYTVHLQNRLSFQGMIVGICINCRVDILIKNSTHKSPTWSNMNESKRN